jgi:hypothetical protein
MPTKKSATPRPWQENGVGATNLDRQKHSRAPEPLRTPLAHALDLHARGFIPVPIPHRQKKCVIHGWPSLRPTVADLPGLFHAQRGNVGVLLGEPSGWRVDIDLDHPRAVELADSFLPPTNMTWGRAGKPRSHRVYLLTKPVKSKRWRLARADKNDPPPAVIVELRSTGCQTVAPGSTHKDSGEAIVWHQDGEPTLIDPDKLCACCEALAAAVRAEFAAVMGLESSDRSQQPGRARAKVRDNTTLTTNGPTDPIDPINPMDPIDPIRTLTPEGVLSRAQVNGRGQQDLQTLVLARGLKLNARLPSAAAARPYFDRWWRTAQTHCSDQDPDAALFKFERAWDTCTIPLDMPGIAASVLEKIGTLPDVPEAEMFGPKLAQLVRALAEMGRLSGGQAFAISARMIAEALKVADSTAHEWIGGLERKRLVRCLDRGRAGNDGKGRARRLVWLGRAGPLETLHPNGEKRC